MMINKISLKVWILAFLCLFLISNQSKAQYKTIPNPMVCLDGTTVNSVRIWENKRRPEILELFETNVYGKTPQADFTLKSSTESEKEIMGGKAMMRQVLLILSYKQKSLSLNLFEIRPAKAKGKIPCFIGLNFDGNQTVIADTSVKITDKWLIDYKSDYIIGNHATRASGGIDSSSWPVSMIIERGYGLITCCAADIDEDRLNYSDGAQALFYNKGQEKPGPDEWGTIGAWAWGLSRMLDYAISTNVYNPERIIVIGHSRMGKTALWAAAQDKRFAAAISNNSGCGGAAIFRNKEGEKIADINRVFPHWFNDNFKKYNNLEDSLPVDQHELIALIAPRPVYVASATNDKWADPKNEFIAVMMAIPVFNLLGVNNIPQFTEPIANLPQQGILSYHLRQGDHDITPWDWLQYLDFADKFVKGNR
ncbi:MAG: acetylxylan esterase [Bacteroidales bacterium]